MIIYQWLKSVLKNNEMAGTPNKTLITLIRIQQWSVRVSEWVNATDRSAESLYLSLSTPPPTYHPSMMVVRMQQMVGTVVPPPMMTSCCWKTMMRQMMMPKMRVACQNGRRRSTGNRCRCCTARPRRSCCCCCYSRRQMGPGWPVDVCSMTVHRCSRRHRFVVGTVIGGVVVLQAQLCRRPSPMKWRAYLRENCRPRWCRWCNCCDDAARVWLTVSRTQNRAVKKAKIFSRNKILGIFFPIRVPGSPTILRSLTPIDPREFLPRGVGA